MIRMAYLVNAAFAARGKPDDELAKQQQHYETLLGISPHELDPNESAIVSAREIELVERLLAAIDRGNKASNPTVS